MPVEVLMPQLTTTMEEGKLLKWLKKQGDKVEQGEPLFECETDKAVVEVEAMNTGFLLKILCGEEEVVKVGQPIAWLGERAENIIPPHRPVQNKAETKRAGSAAAGVAKETGPQRKQVEIIKASPIAKKIAASHGLDLSLIKGSGPGGRILEADVKKYIEQTGKGAVESDLAPLSKFRLAIAEKMSLSARTIPQFSLEAEADMEQAARLIEGLNKKFQGEGAIRFTYTSVFVKACADAINKHPVVNCRYENGALRRLGEINIGVAVASPQGLIVPVVRRADKLSMQETQLALNKIIANAEQGRFSANELAGASFTISNLGMFGINRFNAIINPPESSILAIGRAQKRAMVIGDSVQIRLMASFTLTVDHRILDGADAAEFLTDIVQNIENPVSLLI